MQRALAATLAWRRARKPSFTLLVFMRTTDGSAPLVLAKTLSMGSSVRWAVPTEASEVSALRRQAIEFARAQQVDDPPLAELQIALGEALANVVMHRPAGNGTVAVELHVDHDANRLQLRVCDDGPGLQTPTTQPGLGLGIPLMSAFSDELSIKAREGRAGTEVAMVFHLNDGNRTSS